MGQEYWKNREVQDVLHEIGVQDVTQSQYFPTNKLNVIPLFWKNDLYDFNMVDMVYNMVHIYTVLIKDLYGKHLTDDVKIYIQLKKTRV